MQQEHDDQDVAVADAGDDNAYQPLHVVGFDDGHDDDALETFAVAELDDDDCCSYFLQYR